MVDVKVSVKGTLEIGESNMICPENQQGFFVSLDLNGSQDLIYNNFERIEAGICLGEISSSKVQATLRPHLVKGIANNKLTGKTVHEVLSAQVTPLINAITELAQKLN
jgi:hypothetical protein